VLLQLQLCSCTANNTNAAPLIRKLITIARRDARLFFHLRETDRRWHFPFVAALATGLSLFSGYYLGKPEYGILASIGSLVMLYLPTTGLEHRMVTMLLCSFGFIVSYCAGLIFSFHPYVSAVAIGVFAFGVNWTTNYFRLSPPGNFFFIMLASIASCMPFDLLLIPVRTGLIATGTIIACIVALIYSIYITRNRQIQILVLPARQKVYTNLTDSAIVGSFITLSLIVAHLFHFHHPYWIPVSCLAIMQGMNVAVVRQRGFHRILGTTVGMGLSWLLLHLHLSTGGMCICILLLQFIAEMFIKRHYALAIVFITPMTLFLAEMSRGTGTDADHLITARLFDIIIGSIIGMFGGLLLHNRKLHRLAELQMRKTRIAVLRRH
jgi:uncharacterized membrane protein YccC